MKFKSLLFFVAFFCISFFSFAQEEPTQASVKSDMENGIVNFVNSVKSALPTSEYSSYDEFRLKLIGEANVSTITTEGNELLTATYGFITSDSDEEGIMENGWRPFASATKVVLEFENENGFSGPKLTSGSVHLFGGNTDGILEYRAEKDKCGEYKECNHWYSFGCHAHNTGVWICKNKELITAVLEILVHLL